MGFRGVGVKENLVEGFILGEFLWDLVFNKEDFKEKVVKLNKYCMSKDWFSVQSLILIRLFIKYLVLL